MLSAYLYSFFCTSLTSVNGCLLPLLDNRIGHLRSVAAEHKGRFKHLPRSGIDIDLRRTPSAYIFEYRLGSLLGFYIRLSQVAQHLSSNCEKAAQNRRSGRFRRCLWRLRRSRLLSGLGRSSAASAANRRFYGIWIGAAIGIGGRRRNFSLEPALYGLTSPIFCKSLLRVSICSKSICIHSQNVLDRRIDLLLLVLVGVVPQISGSLAFSSSISMVTFAVPISSSMGLHRQRPWRPIRSRYRHPIGIAVPDRSNSHHSYRQTIGDIAPYWHYSYRHAKIVLFVVVPIPTIIGIACCPSLSILFVVWSPLGG